MKRIVIRYIDYKTDAFYDENSSVYQLNDILFRELVPPSGRADTKIGELLRKTNQIIYRYFNDGDRPPSTFIRDFRDMPEDERRYALWIKLVKTLKRVCASPEGQDVLDSLGIIADIRI